MDPVFPPPDKTNFKKDLLSDYSPESNKFELIFDELSDSHFPKQTNSYQIKDEDLEWFNINLSFYNSC